ncbi:MAG: FkbM family methyltransferase [Pedobacter sp.]|nr:MAG: FkbM family methyltransferase [Pedobacter sp.]
MQSVNRTFGFINQHPLAQKHLFMAYLKFITWQIRLLFKKDLQPVKFIGNTHFLAKKGLTGVTGNIYTGLHEFYDMGFLLHFLKPNDVFFDVGANVGSYTILASGVCGAKTFSFEPLPETFSILQKNVALNRLESLVRLENKGIGSQPGILKFSANEDTTNHVIAADETGASYIEVPVTDLNCYYPNDQPTLIKIDVEGFETEVLNGGEKILDDERLMAIIIELNGSGGRYGYSDHEIHLRLLAKNFKPYSYHPLERSLKELDRYGNFNTIYIRDLKTVTAKVKAAKSFHVFNETI